MWNTYVVLDVEPVFRFYGKITLLFIVLAGTLIQKSNVLLPTRKREPITHEILCCCALQ